MTKKDNISRKSYKKTRRFQWLNRLVDKITKSDAPLNNNFEYYGFQVCQTSGTIDYSVVTIFENYMDPGHRELVDFSFDFRTWRLHFEHYCDLEIRQAVIDAFLRHYVAILVSDGMVNIRKEPEIVDKLPIGWISAIF